MSKKELDDISYNIIKECLKESKEEYININILIKEMIEKTKHISLLYNNRTKTILKYFKIEYKGIIRFIDNYDDFGILKKDKQIYVTLMDELDGWEIINDN